MVDDEPPLLSGGRENGKRGLRGEGVGATDEEDTNCVGRTGLPRKGGEEGAVDVCVRVCVGYSGA